MEKAKSRGLTRWQQAELWSRWKAGQSLNEIGAALGRASGTVHWIIKQEGGIEPRQRSRSCKHLSLAEREEISRCLASGLALREVARRLGRSASTISREVARNGGCQAYRAAAADRTAWSRAERPKACLLAREERLRDLVAAKLQADWSPQQIAKWLRLVHHNEPAMQVSHETIYRSLFIQARGVLKKELVAHLRSRKQMRRTVAVMPTKRGQIVDAISIRERPADVEDRAVPGHWEGDLIVGAGPSYVATLVERHSRYVALARLEGKDSESVVRALIGQVRKLPENLMRTLTWDRGTELAQHKAFTVATDVQVYFCDPRSPWQRGSNENTNGLLRQYLPRSADLSAFSQRQLNVIATKLNTRPRKTLGYITPADKLAASVALTG
ncbi:IS30 family transposase [Hydrogenophaga sp.]|uniref:IS30 family transposase n=1 Tax=Hydrogenophaga sp. TaxID=1904254 RepID=UPI002FCBA29F